GVPAPGDDSPGSILFSTSQEEGGGSTGTTPVTESNDPGVARHSNSSTSRRIRRGRWCGERTGKKRSRQEVSHRKGRTLTMRVFPALAAANSDRIRREKIVIPTLPFVGCIHPATLPGTLLSCVTGLNEGAGGTAQRMPTMPARSRN